jgi:hypothetical protein
MNDADARAELAYIADLRMRLMKAGTVQGTQQTPYAEYYELVELWGNQTDRLFALARYFADELKERTT